MPIVKPMLKLIQIRVQMLNAQLVIRSHNAALKQAPDVLNVVRVNVAPNPLILRVISI